MVRLRSTQRKGCVPRALHLSSYLLSNGLALWLSGELSQITALALTHWKPPHPPTPGLSQRYIHLHLLARALTMKSGPSQSLFVFSEKNKKTGYKKTTRTQWSYQYGPIELSNITRERSSVILGWSALMECLSSNQNVWSEITVQSTVNVKLLPYGLPYRR